MKVFEANISYEVSDTNLIINGKTNILVGVYGSDEAVDKYAEKYALSTENLFSKTDSYFLVSDNNVITVLGKEDAPCDHKYDVTGSLCENNDKFAIDRMLPEVDMGDYLVIHDTGAHGFSMGYNYNGKLKSAELLLKEDGSVQMIRRAETPKDYFATFDCFEVGKKLCK